MTIKTRKAFKFRLVPTQAQEEQFLQFAGNRRFVYNELLTWARETYRETGKGVVNRTVMCRKITQLKQEFEWLKLSHIDTLQAAADDLIKAYVMFFKRKGGYPKYRSKHKQKPSFRYKKGAKVDGDMIFLPKIGWVRFRKSREIEGEIKTAAVRRTASGWYVSLSCETWVAPLPERDEQIGIDVGLKHFATLSNGMQIPNPKPYRTAQRKLGRLDKASKRKQLGSKNRAKANRRLAKQYERVANKRRDFHHKLSTWLINESQVIALEDLNVRGMVKNRRLAKSISDAGWYQFRQMLNYKAAWYGRDVLYIDRFYPSSKTTHCCVAYIEDLTLADRVVECPMCGSVWDRDHNAALNILMVAVGHTETVNACGDDHKPIR